MPIPQRSRRGRVLCRGPLEGDFGFNLVEGLIEDERIDQQPLPIGVPVEIEHRRRIELATDRHRHRVGLELLPPIRQRLQLLPPEPLVVGLGQLSIETVPLIEEGRQPLVEHLAGSVVRGGLDLVDDVFDADQERVPLLLQIPPLTLPPTRRRDKLLCRS